MWWFSGYFRCLFNQIIFCSKKLDRKTKQNFCCNANNFRVLSALFVTCSTKSECKKDIRLICKTNSFFVFMLVFTRLLATVIQMNINMKRKWMYGSCHHSTSVEFAERAKIHCGIRPMLSAVWTRRNTCSVQATLWCVCVVCSWPTMPFIHWIDCLLLAHNHTRSVCVWFMSLYLCLALFCIQTQQNNYDRLLNDVSK